MQRGIERLTKRLEEVQAFNPANIQSRSDSKITALQNSIELTLDSVFRSGTVEYNRYKSAAKIEPDVSFLSLIGRGEPETVSEMRAELSRGRKNSIIWLTEAIRFLEEEIQFKDNNVVNSIKSIEIRNRNKVFIVHGHDNAVLQSVARFLEKLKLETIILREQPDQGRTIIEKFEDCVSDVGFAVVLLTPDDIGGSKSSDDNFPRARQNVIFELGYFAGRLGRGRTCLLREGGVEIPSDLYGVVYTELDLAEAWKMKLVKEMKAANLRFDTEGLWL